MATGLDGALAGKALCGLASIEEAAGHRKEAEELYEEALARLTTSTHPDASLGRATICDALRNLREAT